MEGGGGKLRALARRRAQDPELLPLILPLDTFGGLRTNLRRSATEAQLGLADEFEFEFDLKFDDRVRIRVSRSSTSLSSSWTSSSTIEFEFEFPVRVSG